MRPAHVAILIVNVIVRLRIDSKFLFEFFDGSPNVVIPARILGLFFLSLLYFFMIHWSDIHFLWLHIYISYRLNRHTVCFADLIVVDY